MVYEKFWRHSEPKTIGLALGFLTGRAIIVALCAPELATPIEIENRE